jgi:Ca2+-binding RTX toxin-like protein
MAGGQGDDTYFVDDVGDSTNELVRQGVDTVHATLSWILQANVERLALDGSGDISGTGNALDNVLVGNGGANSLDGGAGNDLLNGGLGADTLIGGAGNDILIGGGGADTFAVTQASINFSHLGGMLESDTLNDLIVGEGDKLDLSAIDADSTTGGDQAFQLVGSFSHQAGQMTLSYSGGTNITTLQLDVDGDGQADYQMRITGDVHLDSGGWVL